MFATHVKVMKGLPHGMIGGVAYNCWDTEQRLSNLKIKKLALKEINRRRNLAGKKSVSMRDIKKPKKGLPLIVIGQGY